MDDTTTPSKPGPLPGRSAEALRQLHERTRSALASQRTRMGELETQLTRQFDSISNILADQGAGAAITFEEVEVFRAEIAALRAAATAEQDSWNEERAAWESERRTLLSAEEDRLQALEQRQFEIESRQQTLDERAADLNHKDRELCQRQAQLDASAAECTAQQAHLAEEASQLAKAKNSLEAALAELRASQASVEHQLVAIAAREQACERDEAQLKADRSAIYIERESLRSAIQAAEAELSAARIQAGAAQERDELKQKFDLALEDMHRLRGRVTELDQELAARPAADQSDSVELVGLRAERDALARRVAELEESTPAPTDSDSAQEMSDLQRRFELAVEDVRDLKKRNSQLEAELEQARSRTANAAPLGVDSAGMSSWELMKRKMIASLEGEVDDSDEIDAVREQERATIENTIHITDEVVANKDREIAELKSQLATGANAPPVEDDKIHAMLDADEVVRQHRERIAQLEREMEDKLRAAELELSVERAKIAREQSQLADLRAELESQRVQGSYSNPGVSQPQTPKRRWLSKLGLTGEEE
jgi:chromosome segregation ATPase